MVESFAAHAERLEQYEPPLILGQLAWFSIPDLLIDHAYIVQAMEKHGLEIYRLPRVPRSVDVFKRGCVAVERKRVPTSEPGIFKNYMIRHVGSDSAEVFRQIVIETVDTDGRKLGYEISAELTFDRIDGKISYKPIVFDIVSNEIIEALISYYTLNNNALTGHTIRELVRSVLEAANATCVRESGGIYFVHQANAEDLFALEELINNIDGCSFVTLPLLDDIKRREMLRKAYEDESIDTIDRILGQAHDIIHSGNGLSSDKYAQIAGQYKGLVAKATEYGKLLNDNLQTTSSRLEIFQATIISLMEHVK